MKKVYSIFWVAVAWAILGFSGGLFAQAPINDDACNAIPLTQFDTLLVFSNEGATVQPGEDVVAPPTTGPAGQTWNESGITHSVWFTFKAPASGAVKFDLCNDSTTFDTQIAVYETTDCLNFGSFLLKAANDDIDGRCPVGDEWASILEVNCLIPDSTYYLIVDGWVAGTTFDSTGNMGIIMSEIPGSVLTAGAFSLDPTCTNTADGIAAVVATGGDQNYTYQWSTGSTNSFLPNVGPGTYTVTVRDGCDSARVVSVVLDDPGQGADLIVSGPDTVLMCRGGSVDIGADVQVKGGVPLVPSSVFATRLSQNGIERFRTKIRTPNSPVGIGTLTGTVDDLRCGDFAFGAFFALDVTNDDLVAININTGAATVVGNTGVLNTAAGQVWLGMAFDQSTGTMYASTGFGGEVPALYTINLGTGVATLVDTFSGVDVLPFWLACDNNGNLYAGETLNDNLVSINKTTAEATVIGFLGAELFFVDVQDADFDPKTNQLYMSATGQNDTRSQLYAVDVNTGLSVPIGGFPGGSFVSAFAIEDVVNSEYSYTWTPNNFIDDLTSSNPIVNPPPGFPPYTVTVRDECGDIARDTIRVVVPNDLTVSASSTPDSTGSSGSASVTLMDGVPPFAIQWNTGDTTATISGLQGDSTYSYVVSDACGTILGGDVLVLGTTSVEDLIGTGLTELLAYPNPTSQTLFVKVAPRKMEDVNIELLDARGASIDGRLLPNTLGEEIRLDMSSLANGLYILKVSTSEGTAFRKVVKK